MINTPHVPPIILTQRSLNGYYAEAINVRNEALREEGQNKLESPA